MAKPKDLHIDIYNVFQRKLNYFCDQCVVKFDIYVLKVVLCNIGGSWVEIIVFIITVIDDHVEIFHIYVLKGLTTIY